MDRTEVHQKQLLLCAQYANWIGEPGSVVTVFLLLLLLLLLLFLSLTEWKEKCDWGSGSNCIQSAKYWV